MKRIMAIAIAVMTGLWILQAAATAAPSIKDASTAAANALPPWMVKTFDEAPSVSFGTSRGYRVLLWKQITTHMAAQQPLANGPIEYPDGIEIRLDYMEVILFPSSDAVPQDAAKLPWQDCRRKQYIRAVDMGEGMGFRWFVNAAPAEQQVLRTKLGLKGGDDPIKIQIDALSVGGDSNQTRAGVSAVMYSMGDSALPYLREAIPGFNGDALWYAIQAVGAIRTPKSAEYLRELYWSKVEGQSKAAAYALIGWPVRDGAAKEYADMISKRMYVQHAAQACRDFRIKEALPALKEILAKPDSWIDYRSAFEAIRSIQNRPIPREITEAADVIGLTKPGQPEIDAAIATISGHPDGEAAAVAAMGLALYVTKADREAINSIHEAGVSIFRSLPAHYTAPVLASLKNLKRTNWDYLDPFFGPYQEAKPEQKKLVPAVPAGN